MEAPLEFNEGLREASDLGKLDNNPKFKAAVDAAPKMISTGVAGVDPMTGMPQANQLTPTAINPNALGSMQPQIPSIAGTPQAGSYNNVMPQPAQAGLAAPLQHKMKNMHIHPTEFTGKIQTKEDGQEYSLIEPDGNQRVSDTLKPVGLKFPKHLVTKDKLLKGSMDLSASKTGPKTFTLNFQNN